MARLVFHQLGPTVVISDSSVNHARIQKVLSEEIQLWQRFFFGGGGGGGGIFDEGRHEPNASISRPSSTYQWNIIGVLMAGRWWPNIDCWLGIFVIFQGIRTSIAKKSYFCDFSGGGGGRDPLSHPPLWIRAWVNDTKTNIPLILTTL